MKKTNILWIVLDLVFLVIFNAVFFIAGGIEHTVPVWISYGFIHLSYFLLIFTFMLVRKGGNPVIYGLPLYTISSVYFITELIVGIVFIIVAPEEYRVALLVQLILMGIYGIMLIAIMIANEHTADAGEKKQGRVGYIKQTSAKLKQIADRVSDRETKKKLEKVYDTLYSSPVNSRPDMEQIEKEILDTVDELDTAVFSENKDLIIHLADSLLCAITNRNTQLRNLN